MFTYSNLTIFGRVFDHLRERALARAGIRFLKEEEEEEEEEKAVKSKKGARCGAQVRLNPHCLREELTVSLSYCDRLPLSRKTSVSIMEQFYPALRIWRVY